MKGVFSKDELKEEVEPRSQDLANWSHLFGSLLLPDGRRLNCLTYLGWCEDSDRGDLSICVPSAAIETLAGTDRLLDENAIAIEVIERLSAVAAFVGERFAFEFAIVGEETFAGYDIEAALDENFRFDIYAHVLPSARMTGDSRLQGVKQLSERYAFVPRAICFRSASVVRSAGD